MNAFTQDNLSAKEYYALLKSIFDTSPTPMIVGHVTGDIIAVNDAMSRVFGYQANELRRIGRAGIVIQDDFERKILAERQLHGKATGVMNFRRKNGEVFRGLVSSSFITDLRGNEYAFTTIVDLSKQDELEHEIEERNRYLNSVLDSASDYIAVEDRHGNRKLISKSAETILGYSKKELEAIPPIDLVYKDDKAKVLYLLEHVTELRGGEITEARLVHKDGHPVWLSWAFNLDKQTGDICLIGRDVTEMRKNEAALKESESRFKSYLEFSGDAIFVHDFGGSILEVNKKACKSFGYTAEEFTLLNVGDLNHHINLAQFQTVWSRLEVNESLILNCLILKKDGSTFQAEMQVSRFNMYEKAVYMTQIRDVSAQKANEASLLKIQTELKIKNSELLRRIEELENAQR
jgi:PAS domain S-box-containing protein